MKRCSWWAGAVFWSVNSYSNKRYFKLGTTPICGRRSVPVRCIVQIPACINAQGVLWSRHLNKGFYPNRWRSDSPAMWQIRPYVKSRSWPKDPKHPQRSDDPKQGGSWWPVVFVTELCYNLELNSDVELCTLTPLSKASSPVRWTTGR